MRFRRARPPTTPDDLERVQAEAELSEQHESGRVRHKVERTRAERDTDANVAEQRRQAGRRCDLVVVVVRPPPQHPPAFRAATRP